MTSKTEPTSERPVVVTTEYRGVFFGYASDTSGDTITLRAGRNCREISTASEMRANRGQDTAVMFFGGTAAIVVGFLFYAGLKRWR